MTWFNDLQQAWRSLRGSPGFLLLASGVLALGLAATIFMYGVTYTMLEKAPPYPDGDQLIGIRNTIPDIGALDNGFSYLDLVDIRERQKSFSDLSGMYNGTMTFTGAGRPERISGSFVGDGLLEALRVTPMLGRGFRAEDHQPGAAPTVILMHEFWRTRFNADPGIVGTTLKLNGELAQIIGVMPQNFAMPSRSDQAITALRQNRATARRADPNEVRFALYGRLRPGVSVREANADLEAIFADLIRRYPDEHKGHVPVVLTMAHTMTGQDGVQIISLMFYAVWAVLAIACANVASLLFVRANQRAYESSMRAALGATRLRLVRLTLAESLIVAGLASLVGLLLAAVALDVMRRFMNINFDDAPSWWDFTVNWRVVLFATGAALLSGMLAGLWPAWRASRPDVMQVLRDGGRSGTGLRLSRFTSTMVVVEIALAVALLTGAGVMVRTTLASLNAEIGVSNAGVMTGRVMLPENVYDVKARTVFWPRLVARLAAIPGAQRAYATDQLPGTGGEETVVAIEGRRYADAQAYPRTTTVVVSPGFFTAVERGMLRGREFAIADGAETLKVAVVNQAFVDAILPGVEPLGRRIKLNPLDAAAEWLTVVGVAPNIKYETNFEKPGEMVPVVYTSLGQMPARFVSIAVRGDGDPRRFTEPMRAAVQSLDNDLPMYFIDTLAGRQDTNKGGVKVITTIFSIFALVAIVLAASGLYGVLAFTTSQRVREFGIRRSLGARDGQILKSVLRGALLQMGLGLGIGAVLAPVLVSMLPNFMTRGQPHDPIVYGIVFGLVSACALAASWTPSRRALRVEPAVALRYE